MALITTRQTGLPGGFSGGGGQAYTRDVQAGELAGNQLTGLLAGGGAYIQNARSRGEEFAQSRLLGNSSIAAGASERAAIEAAAPIAMQQAGAEQQAASENLGYLNQYEIADRQNAAQIDVANIGAQASMGVAKIGAESAMRQLEAKLGFSGQQADLDRAHSIFMGNLGFNQDLQRMAAGHGFDLDNLAANAFYDMQGIAAIDALNVRDSGMAFVMGGYNNYTQMISNAMMGDFDTAAFNRLIGMADGYLSNTMGFGQNLFGNFPAFNFGFSAYGDGG